MDQTQRTYTFAARLAGATALRVVIVGLGGTGYHLLHQLLGVFYALEDARVAGVPLPEHALGRLPISLALVDPDTVEPKNVGRQKWRPADVGQFKARAAAAYCAREYGMRAEYHVRYFADAPKVIGDAAVTLLISCVDNAAARRAMHILLDKRDQPAADPYGYGRRRDRLFVLVDCGNERDTGQVFVGTTMDRARLTGAFSAVGLASEMPAAGLLDPGLLVDAAPGPRQLGPDGDDCAARVLRGEQSITINTHVAALATQLVTDLLLGTLRTMGGFIDAQSGVKTTPVALTPRNVAGLVSGYTEDADEMGLLHGACSLKRVAPRADADASARRVQIPAAAVVALDQVPPRCEDDIVDVAGGSGASPVAIVLGTSSDGAEATGAARSAATGTTAIAYDASAVAPPREEADSGPSGASPSGARFPRLAKKRRVRSHRADARAAGQAPPRDGGGARTGSGAGTTNRSSRRPRRTARGIATP